MFEGGGFGVGLAVNQLATPSCGAAELLPSDQEWHPARLGELMPVAARSNAEMAEEMRRANIADSRLWAYRVEMIVQLATRCSDDRDRPAGVPGAASPSWSGRSPLPEGVSEFFPDELALIMNCSRSEATRLTAVAWTLFHRLPQSWAALADGELNWARARAIAAEINRYGPDLDLHLVATVEAVVLPQAAELPVGRLQALVRAEVVRRDAEAAERRRQQARSAADVLLRRSRLDGMSEVVTVVPQPVAAAMYDAVDTHARNAKVDGDQRPIGVIRADIMANMALRPWDDRRPPVTAELRVLAPLNSLLADPSAPEVMGRPAGVAEVEGEPITVEHLRALLPLSMPSVRAACRRPPVARCTSICSAPAVRCSRPSRVASSTRRSVAGAPSTPRVTAAARWWNDLRRARATHPRRPSGGGPRRATVDAATPAAATRPAGRTWTTSSRTPTAGRPTATTCAACAAGTIG